MGQGATRTRENRTITVDFQDETTYFQLLGDGKAFVELVLAFILSLAHIPHPFPWVYEGFSRSVPQACLH